MMQDIGSALNSIMQSEQCSPIYAFFLLSGKKVGENNVHELQSESKTKAGRGLCNKSNF